MKPKRFKAIVVGEKDSESTLTELQLLLDTLHIETITTMIINLRHKDPATYITKGKLEELRILAESMEADIIAFDFELSSTQIRNLKKILGGILLDRPRIILEIFAQRATTREGKVQVELASLQKRLPEIIDQKASLDQQFGVIGMKGPGERSLELTRRNVYARINKLKKRLKELQKQRKIQRDRRIASDSFLISIVGYTNAGKSTLFNALTKEDLPTDNLLFHTLDTRTRKGFISKEIGDVLFIDTVGFIRKLPHELIEAFKGTLEEIKLSDLILLVLDSSDQEFYQQYCTVVQTLTDLGANEIKTILVLNKADIALKNKLPQWFLDKLGQEAIFVSAMTTWNIDLLKQKIAEIIDERLSV